MKFLKILLLLTCVSFVLVANEKDQTNASNRFDFYGIGYYPLNSYSFSTSEKTYPENSLELIYYNLYNKLQIIQHYIYENHKKMTAEQISFFEGKMETYIEVALLIKTYRLENNQSS